MKTVYTANAPEPIGPYSQAIECGGLLYLSGQIPVNPQNGQMCGENVADQTEQVCNNIKHVLEAAGYSFDNVVKTTCFLINPADFAAFNDVYARYFTSKPARSTVFVNGLPKGALVEVEVIAKK